MIGLSALELAEAVRSEQIGVAEAVKAYLERIENIDSQLNAFLTVSRKEALTRAEVVQKKISAGERLSALAGVPIALKDNISTTGVTTTCASKCWLAMCRCITHSVVDKLEQAGMIVIGKLNMDEFAMGGSSETGAFGPVRNPWDMTRVAGGSSGGCAAAVAGRRSHCARFRYGRQYTSTMLFLRRDRHQADIRLGFSLRSYRLRVVSDQIGRLGRILTTVPLSYRLSPDRMKRTGLVL